MMPQPTPWPGGVTGAMSDTELHRSPGPLRAVPVVAMRPDGIVMDNLHLFRVASTAAKAKPFFELYRAEGGHRDAYDAQP